MNTVIELRLHANRRGGRTDKVDLGALTPRARAIAEAWHAGVGAQCGVWVESTIPLRDLVRADQASAFYSEDELAASDLRCYVNFPPYWLEDGTPEEYLEKVAIGIPDGWRIVGAHPRKSVPSAASAASVREVSGYQDLHTYVSEHGVTADVKTLTGYVSRGQMPKPVRYVGRTPVWDLEAVDEWLGARVEREKVRRARTDGLLDVADNIPHTA